MGILCHPARRQESREIPLGKRTRDNHFLTGRQTAETEDNVRNIFYLDERSKDSLCEAKPTAAIVAYNKLCNFSFNKK